MAGILGIPIAGLGVVIGLMSVMKEMGFRTELIIAFMSLSFLLLLAAETVFIWLLLQNRRRTEEQISNTAQLKEVEVQVLGEAQMRQLSEPIPSVIENITRSFGAVHRDPKMR